MQIVTFLNGLLAPFYALMSNPDPTQNFGVLCMLAVIVVSILGLFIKMLKGEC